MGHYYNVLNGDIQLSVDGSELDASWIKNPQGLEDVVDLATRTLKVPLRHIKRQGDIIASMTWEERDAVDASNALDKEQRERATAKQRLGKDLLLQAVLIWALQNINELRTELSMGKLSITDARQALRDIVDGL